MIEYNKKCVGIIQYKMINYVDKKFYGLSVDNCFEIDIFIGELDCHNKGIGRSSIKIISDYLLKNKSSELLVMCPLK